MAIDTEDKRRSVVANLPVPDSFIDIGDRRQITWNYRHHKTLGSETPATFRLVSVAGTYLISRRGVAPTYKANITDKKPTYQQDAGP